MVQKSGKWGGIRQRTVGWRPVPIQRGSGVFIGRKQMLMATRIRVKGTVAPVSVVFHTVSIHCPLGFRGASKVSRRLVWPVLELASGMCLRSFFLLLA